MITAFLDYCRYLLASQKRRDCSLAGLRFDNPDCCYDLFTSRRTIEAARDDLYLWGR